jgi:GntR family transcriptional regulator of arabinose operon
MSSINTTTAPDWGAKSIPKYARVRDQLHEQIRSGKLAPGQSLPTEAKLMEALGISRHTVRQALAELENGGFVERIQGRGTFVTTTQQRQAQKQLDMFALIAPRVREGFYPSLVHGFEQACASHQQQVVVGNSLNDPVRQGDLVLQMIDRAVGGVALVPTTVVVTPAYQIRQLQQHHIPVVYCHRPVEGASAPCVTWSGHDVGRTAGKLLVELGHRRLAALFAHSHVLTRAYVDGLRSACVDAGNDPNGVELIEYGSAAILPPEEVAKAVHTALARLLARADRPTAIFCGNLPDAELVYLQADSFGLKIPRDLSLIYFGGTWRDHGIAQHISCVAVDEHEVGTKAAELLYEMRAGKRPLDDDERFVFPVSLLSGETVGPAPDEGGADVRNVRPDRNVKSEPSGD